MGRLIFTPVGCFSRSQPIILQINQRLRLSAASTLCGSWLHRPAVHLQMLWGSGRCSVVAGRLQSTQTMLGVRVYLFVAWFGNLDWKGCVCVCVYRLTAHTLCINTLVYLQYAGSCVCVCLSTPSISPICHTILAAFLFKPQCPSCATSTIERPIVYFASLYTWFIRSLLSELHCKLAGLF